jgi:sulfite exporter TauE/SafE
MNTAATLGVALLMGLTGSLHCAGMCGPIVWVMPFQSLSGVRKWLGIFLYHFGRATAYALLALLLYSFRSVFNPQVQQYISIILGCLLLIAGIVSFFPGNKVKMALPWTEFIKQQLGKFIGKPGVGTFAITGFLNGLLPCGLVYMALAAGITTSSSLQAMEFMYVFGLGTLPMLVSLTILKGRLNIAHLLNMRKVVPVLMLCFGCLFMLRGMNLGIPYLSPKIVVTNHSVKACCCHKK